MERNNCVRIAYNRAHSALPIAHTTRYLSISKIHDVYISMGHISVQGQLLFVLSSDVRMTIDSYNETKYG